MGTARGGERNHLEARNGSGEGFFAKLGGATTLQKGGRDSRGMGTASRKNGAQKNRKILLPFMTRDLGNEGSFTSTAQVGLVP